jgi:hypothetical protein
MLTVLPFDNSHLSVTKIMVGDEVYSNPPNTKLSGIQMVIFRTLFVSGFQMVVAILFLPFEILTRYFLTCLDHFGTNKIFFMTLINKTV